MAMKNDPRILLYSHDTFGLGHLRRSLAIAAQIAQDIPGASQLLLTGSMVAGAFDLPPGLDMVKLPALTKRSDGRYTARVLPLTLKQTLNWREQMILQAAINFEPDLLLVDKAAAGVQGELLPTLRYLKAWSPQTRLVLGMRDIEDAPAATIREWRANGVPALLEDVYDQILYYGQRSVFDAVAQYRMSDVAAGKLVECGYLRRAQHTRLPAEVRQELGIGEQPLVVVTVGGGGDGHELINGYLQMLSQSRCLPFHSLLVTGPLMTDERRDLLEQMADRPDVTFMKFTPDLVSYMRAADLVISMAGYNTTCEILSLQKRAILVPRVKVRQEQKLRASHLADLGLTRQLLPHQLQPSRLLAEIERSLALPEPIVNLNLDGLNTITKTIQSALPAPAPKASPVVSWPALKPVPVYA